MHNFNILLTDNGITMLTKRKTGLHKSMPPIMSTTGGASVTIMYLAIAILCATVGELEAAPPNDSERIANHLEFLGYNIKKTEYSLRAKHPNKITVYLREYDGGILFYLYVKLKETAKTDRLEYLEFLNRLNTRLTVARAIAHKENRLKLEAWLPGGYEKTSFSLFFDEWNNDLYRNLSKERDGLERFFQ